MATHSLSFFHSLIPLANSGGPVLFSPINRWIGGERGDLANRGVLATYAGRDDLPVLVLPKRGQARIGCIGRFRVPRNFVGTSLVTLVWATDAPANTLRARLEVDYRALAVGESIDQAVVESVAVNAAGQDVAWELTETSFTLTASNFAVNDTVLVSIFRDHLQADPNDDNVPGPIYILDATFTYNDV